MENTTTLETDVALKIFKMHTRSSFNTTTTKPETLLYSYGERIFVATCWLLISILGSVGNSMVIVAVLFSNKLRTITNVFVINLAVADMLTCLFLVWSVVALLGPDGWPLPNAEWLCVAGGFMLYVCTGSSLYNLAAISLNRLALITLPFETYMKLYRKSNVTIMVAVIWMIPLSVYTFLPLAGVGGFGYDQQHSTCSDLDHHPKSTPFHLTQTIVFYPFPLIAIIVSYTLVFRHIKRHFQKQRQNTESSDQRKTSVTVMSSSDVSSKKPPTQNSARDAQPAQVVKNKQVSRTHRINQMEVEITKNLFLVVCAFFLLFSPYFIALFIPGSDYFLLYGGIFVLANSCINPVIYARRHPHFKRIFRCMIRCRYRDIPEPSSLLKTILRNK